MRHRLSRLRLRHKPAHNNSMVRNLVTSVLLYESIRTTKKRAEVAQPVVERMITIAKTKKPYVAIRAINEVVQHKNACRKTMEVLRERFADRSSGFTRIVPLGSRIGDGAKVVTLALVEGREVKAVEKKPRSPRKPKSPKSEKKTASSSKKS
jgi:large subunit ribosomal protein L17